MISVNLSSSWNWKTNLTERVTNGTVNPKTGASPPQLSQGTLFQGSPSDPSFYLYGGTTTWANASFPGFQGRVSPTYSLWAYDSSTATWSQHDISMSVPYRPSSGAHAEAPDQSLAFYFNGEINDGSSTGLHLASGYNAFLTGMVVINTTDHTAKNLSTASVTGMSPRARAQMQYVPGIGEKGILVLLGGSSKAVGEYGTTDLLDLVQPLSQGIKRMALTLVGANDRRSNLRRWLLVQYLDTKWNVVQTKCHSSQCHWRA